MKMWGVLTVAMGFVAAALATAGAQVQSQPYSGSADYQTYCSACHGADGKGEGSIAKTLKKHPSDLTQMTKHNNGVFPDEKVVKTIDGKQGSAHTDSDMPSWGDVFAKSSESAGADKAAVRIDTLVKYLQTLQAK